MFVTFKYDVGNFKFGVSTATLIFRSSQSFITLLYSALYFFSRALYNLSHLYYPLYHFKDVFLCFQILFIHIIVSSILKHLDAHQILTDCQHGFRARCSCETQLLTLAHELLSSLDVGYQHDLIILDLLFPVCQFVEVILEYNGIFVRSNIPVENTVIRKESYAWLYTVREIVYKDQELQKRSIITVSEIRHKDGSRHFWATEHNR
jgi:hypothetical protein